VRELPRVWVYTNNAYSAVIFYIRIKPLIIILRKRIAHELIAHAASCIYRYGYTEESRQVATSQ